MKDEPAGSADVVLLELARAVLTVSQQAAERVGRVSLVQLRALTVLAAEQPLNLSGLGDWLGVTVSTASRLVDRLVAAGLVHRAPADHSRREVALTLTGSGRQVLTGYDRQRLTRLRAALENIDRSHRARLLADLTALTAGMTDDVSGSAPEAEQPARSRTPPCPPPAPPR